MMKATKRILVWFVSFAAFGFCANAEVMKSLPVAEDEVPEDLAQELGIPESPSDHVYEFHKGYLGDFLAEDDDLSIFRMDSSSPNPNPLGINPKDFDVVAVVNKAITGSAAQTLTLYEKGEKTQIVYVSTGREKWEVTPSGKKTFTSTPLGMFKPFRLVKDYVSKQWKAPMNYSVFFKGGVALHAANPGAVEKLGHRASAGCVRLHPDFAPIIFEKIKSTATGRLVPMVSLNTGDQQYDAQGKPIMIPEYNSLIIVEQQEAKVEGVDI